MQRLQAVLLLCLACCWPGLAGALTLTPEERAWLAEHPSIRLGVDTSWPPFEFRDEQGRYQDSPPATSACCRNAWASA